MAEYVPSPTQWVREQVELYEASGGMEGTELRDSGLPVIVVTNSGPYEEYQQRTSRIIPVFVAEPA